VFIYVSVLYACVLVGALQDALPNAAAGVGGRRGDSLPPPSIDTTRRFTESKLQRVCTRAHSDAFTQSDTSQLHTLSELHTLSGGYT